AFQDPKGYQKTLRVLNPQTKTPYIFSMYGVLSSNQSKLARRLGRGGRGCIVHSFYDDAYAGDQRRNDPNRCQHRRECHPQARADYTDGQWHFDQRLAIIRFQNNAAHVSFIDQFLDFRNHFVSIHAEFFGASSIAHSLSPWLNSQSYLRKIPPRVSRVAKTCQTVIASWN